MESESTKPPGSSATSELERESITTRALEHIRQLVESRRQKIMALVAYGQPGHEVDILWRELRYEIDRRASRFTAVQWVPLMFPQLRDRLYSNLEYELETQLGSRAGEVMQQVFERIAPLPSEASQRVIWLDWGWFCAPPSSRRKLTHHELQIWLQFCSDFLTAHCPRRVRIVSYIAIETAKPDELSEFLTEQRNESWCKRAEFRLKTLAFSPPGAAPAPAGDE